MECWMLASNNSAELKQNYYFHVEFLEVRCIPGEKERVSARYIIINTRISCEFSRVLQHGAAPNHFRCDRKRKLEQSASILCAFEPSATKLQSPRVSPATSLLECRNANFVKFWTVFTRAFWRDCTWNGNYPRTFAYNRIVLTNACANRAFTRSFSPGMYIGPPIYI